MRQAFKKKKTEILFVTLNQVIYRIRHKPMSPFRAQGRLFGREEKPSSWWDGTADSKAEKQLGRKHQEMANLRQAKQSEMQHRNTCPEIGIKFNLWKQSPIHKTKGSSSLLQMFINECF